MTWYNKTEHRCQICSCAFSKINGFVEHISALHEMSVGEYKSEFGMLTANQIDYECQICEQVLKCDADVIKR